MHKKIKYQNDEYTKKEGNSKFYCLHEHFDPNQKESELETISADKFKPGLADFSSTQHVDPDAVVSIKNEPPAKPPRTFAYASEPNYATIRKRDDGQKQTVHFSSAQDKTQNVFDARKSVEKPQALPKPSFKEHVSRKVQFFETLTSNTNPKPEVNGKAETFGKGR